MLSTFDEKKLYMRQLERKINSLENIFILREKLVRVSFIKLLNIIVISRWRHLCDCLIKCLRKSTYEIGLGFLLIFFIFINFFMKAFI